MILALMVPCMFADIRFHHNYQRTIKSMMALIERQQMPEAEARDTGEEEILPVL